MVVGSAPNSICSAVAEDAVCLLASGRPCPAVRSYSPRSGQLDVLSILESHDVPSVVALSNDGCKWAAGTRSGILCFGTTSRTINCENKGSARWRLVGEPVLDVCHLFDETWATTDAVGRVMIWSPKADPISLPNAGGPVLALASASNHHLMGIAADGHLLNWNVPANRLVESIEGTPPPTIASRPFLTRWSTVGAWVWPAEGGRLAILVESTRQISTLHIHQGVVLAAFAVDGAICTVGQKDRRLRVWRSLNEKPFREFALDIDPAGLTLAGVEPLRFMIITEEGCASLWALGSDGADRIATINDDSYCALAAPSWEAQVSCEKVNRLTRARILAEQINSHAPYSEVVTNPLHVELESIGFRHVSLALKAERHRKQNDVSGELIALHQLTLQASIDAVFTPELLLRYRQLLEDTGLVHTLEEQPSVQSRDTLDTSRNSADPPHTTTRTDTLVIESRVSFDVTLRAALAMGLRPKHRFLVRRLNTVRIEHEGAKPEHLLERLISRKYSDPPAPELVPALEQVSWMQGCQRELTSLIMVGACGELTGLQIGLRHIVSQRTQIYELVILLTPADCPFTTSSDTADEFVGLPKAAAFRWLDRMRRTFDRELRGLLTEFSSRRRR